MMQQQRALSGTSSRAGGAGARGSVLLPRRPARRAASAARASAPSAAAPRAVVILPGLGNDAADYAPLADLLRRSGAAHVAVAPVERWNWALNALALRDARWWRGELPPRPAVDWYIRRTDEAVREAAEALEALGAATKEDQGRVTLLAHSAGGWIGRVYLRDFRSQGGGGAAARRIDRFVSLGSPHRAPPRGVEGVVDQTRGILTWVEDNCPGAHLHDEGVRYVTVAGRLVRGRALGGAGGGKAAEEGSGVAASAAAAFAGVGYQQVCGKADAHGDFIVPVDAAHLGDPRAAEVDLEGVFHSPIGETLRWPLGGGRAVLPPWYGSERVAGAWVRWAVGTEDELPAPGTRHRARAEPWKESLQSAAVGAPALEN